MEIKFEQGVQMVHAWLRGKKQEELALKIAEKLHEIDSSTSLLLHPCAPRAGDINKQRLFRANNGWINGYTIAQRQKFLALLPAIELAIAEDKQSMLVARARSHSSETFREMVTLRNRIDIDTETLFGVMIGMASRHYGSGPAGTQQYH